MTAGAKGAHRPRGDGPGLRGPAAQADDPAARREPARAGARGRRVRAGRPDHLRCRPDLGHDRVLDRAVHGRHRRGRRRATPGRARTATAGGPPPGPGARGRRSTCPPTRRAARRRRAGQLAPRAVRPTSSSGWRPAGPAARGCAGADPGPRSGTDPRSARPRWPTGGRPMRPAGVLVLLYPDDGGLARVVLTERPTRDGHHSGEVSLPGGKAEPHDADIAATALREAAEEVGLDAAAAGVRVVGLLERFVIPVSDFALTPVVGRRRAPPGPGRVGGARWPGSSSRRWPRSCPAPRSRSSSGRSATGRCATAPTTSSVRGRRATRARRGAGARRRRILGQLGAPSLGALRPAAGSGTVAPE